MKKIIQLLCYALMFENHELKQNREVSAGIVSFKKYEKWLFAFRIREKEKMLNLFISNVILQDFKSELENIDCRDFQSRNSVQKKKV